MTEQERDVLRMLRRETADTLADRVADLWRGFLHWSGLRRPSPDTLKSLGLDTSMSYRAIRRELDKHSAERHGLPTDLPSNAYAVADLFHALRLAREVAEHEAESAALADLIRAKDAEADRLRSEYQNERAAVARLEYLERCELRELRTRE